METLKKSTQATDDWRCRNTFRIDAAVLLVVVLGAIVFGAFMLERRPHPRSEPVEACGTGRDGVMICADVARRAAELGEGVQYVQATPDASFVLVRVRVVNNGARSIDVSAYEFELVDHASRVYERDLDAMFAAISSGLPILSGNQVHPGMSLEGWLVYYVPRGPRRFVVRRGDAAAAFFLGR